jgi:hypothetical protein
VITQENWHEAADAVRDILLMYEGIARDGLIGHNADWPIRFDPLKFVDVVQSDSRSWYVDIDLLRAGAALAVFAAFYNGWSEEFGIHAFKDTERFTQAVHEGRLHHVSDVDVILREFFEGRHADATDPWFDAASARLCTAHVRAYFRRLADGDLSGRGPQDWTALSTR